MTEVGSGIIDWPPLLARARSAGVEYFLGEQDDAAESRASITSSFSYLQNLRLPAIPAHHGRLKQAACGKRKSSQRRSEIAEQSTGQGAGDRVQRRMRAG